MLTTDLAEQVLPALRQGRYALLLGAGASMASHASDGSPLPSGTQLRDEIAAKFGLPSRYSLAKTASAIEDGISLTTFLKNRFANCKPSPGAMRVPLFVWRAIYSLNIDDVVQASYRAANSLQKIKTLTYADSFYEPSDTEEVKAIFLHGSVATPEKGFIFSLQDYGNIVARDSVWLKILADEITFNPFIVIGASLEESDIEYYLARRSSLPPDAVNTAPSLFVSRTIDSVTRATCRRFGLVPVESDAETFLLQLDALAGTRPSALELVLPRDRDSLFKGLPTERAQRVFFRQWIVVDPLDLPAQLPEKESISLLRGTEPHWSQLLKHQDVERSTLTEILQRIIVWVQSGTRQRTVEILLSGAGSGKSTGLMRLCLNLVASGVRVFYFTGNERIADAETVELIQKLVKPAVFIVDSIAEHATQVAAIIKRLDELRLSHVYIVGAERIQRRERVSNAFVNMPFKSTELARLSSSEALALVAKLRNEGLLGRKAGRSDPDLAHDLRAQDLFSGVLTLAGGSPNAEHIAMSEWDEMSPDTQTVYSVIALAHSCNLPTRNTLLSRATSLDASKTWRIIMNDLKGIAFRTGRDLSGIETRHRRVAEFTMRGMPLSQRFRAFVGLAKALAPYINRNAVMKSTADARLGGRLLDYDDTVKPLLSHRSREFYEEISDGWSWNSRYWEQRALLEIETDPDLALHYAETAIGIEYHPFSLTTLAKVHYQLARKSTQPEIALSHLRKGLESADEAIKRSKQMNRREPHAFDISLRSIVDVCSALMSTANWAIDPFIDSKFREYIESAEDLLEKDNLESWKHRWAAIRRKEPTSSIQVRPSPRKPVPERTSPPTSTTSSRRGRKGRDR